MVRPFCLFASLGIGLMLLVGCAKDRPAPPREHAQTPSTQPSVTPAPTQVSLTHELTRDEAYYKTGPQQARPPEGTLRKGTRVGVVRDAGSYTEVMAEDGTRGYVPTGSLRPIEKTIRH